MRFTRVRLILVNLLFVTLFVAQAHAELKQAIGAPR